MLKLSQITKTMLGLLSNDLLPGSLTLSYFLGEIPVSSRAKKLEITGKYFLAFSSSNTGARNRKVVKKFCSGLRARFDLKLSLNLNASLHFKGVKDKIPNKHHSITIIV